MAFKLFVIYGKSLILDISGFLESLFCACCRQFQAHLLYCLSIYVFLELEKALQGM